MRTTLLSCVIYNLSKEKSKAFRFCNVSATFQRVLILFDLFWKRQTSAGKSTHAIATTTVENLIARIPKVFTRNRVAGKKQISPRTRDHKSMQNLLLKILIAVRGFSKGICNCENGVGSIKVNGLLRYRGKQCCLTRNLAPKTTVDQLLNFTSSVKKAPSRTKPNKDTEPGKPKN